MITITFIKVWFLMLLLGVFGFPIFFCIFRNLHDRGYGIVKYASLVIISYIGWILAHCGIEFVRSTLWIIALLYFAVGVVLFFIRRDEIIEYLKKQIIVLFIIELVFFCSFGYFVKIASYNASIVVEPGTEAMMDYMMIQSVLRSKVFPQWDLWLSGEKVNYYYFGWVNVAALKLLSGIDLPVMFNAAIALVYALIFTSAFGLGYNFCRKYRYGFLTSLLMIIVGNLNGFVQVMGDKTFFGIDWFQSARVIEGTINEFPYFSLIYGDLHSYVLAFPVAMICLYISLNLFFERDKITFFAERKSDNVLSFIVYTITFGSLIPTNTWDYPAYLMIFVISFAVRNFVQEDLNLLEKIKKTIIPAVSMLISGIVAYLPYFMAFKQKREVKLVSFSRSLFSDFFEMFGTYITFTLLMMFIALFMMNKEKGNKQYWMFSLFIFSSAIMVFQEITYLYLTAYILFGLFIILKLLFSGNQEKAFVDDKTMGKEQEPAGEGEGVSVEKSLIYITALALLAASYGLWCEFFFVKDHYGGDLERMNTIFKVYLQMWFIWSFAASYGVYIVSAKLMKDKNPVYKAAWFVVVFAFIGMGIVYPISSTYIRCGGFNYESTLEGLKRTEQVHYQDYKAIKWMQENVQGLPVVLEACANAYEWASRFATFAGFPTILGWANHEAGWRNDWDTVNKRWSDVNLAYQTTDITQVMQIFDKYNVQYVVVGELERKNYSAASLSKFKDFMDIVYDRDGVRIYKRK